MKMSINSKRLQVHLLKLSKTVIKLALMGRRKDQGLALLWRIVSLELWISSLEFLASDIGNRLYLRLELEAFKWQTS